MSTNILEIPHPDRQPNFFEQRELFRKANQERIHNALGWYTVKRRNKLTGEWEDVAIYGLNEQHDMASFDTDMNFIGEQLFGTESVTPSEAKQLEDDAYKAYLFEAMVLPEGEGVDHDAPPLRYPVENCSDDDLLYYLDQAVGEMRDHELRKDT